jgi:hypothetical protein
MATHDQLTAYRDNPAKVREADEGWSGTLDGDTYAEMESALADLFDSEVTVSSEAMGRILRLARICADARTAELHKLIQADEDARELDRLEQITERAA